jgi:hypothetical protein
LRDLFVLAEKLYCLLAVFANAGSNSDMPSEPAMAHGEWLTDETTNAHST